MIKTKIIRNGIMVIEKRKNQNSQIKNDQQYFFMPQAKFCKGETPFIDLLNLGNRIQFE